MPEVPLIIQLRHDRLKKSKRSSYGFVGLGCALLISLMVIIAMVSATLIYSALVVDLPSPEILPALLDGQRGELRQPTRLYDRTGEHVIATFQNPGAAGSEYLHYPLDQGANPASQQSLPLITPTLISTTLASTDQGFWQHPGFTFSWPLESDHPTIAEQLAADLLLWKEPPGIRKTLRERLLAAQITSRFGRTQLLEWYLNSANYGQNAYGVDAAARVYFQKPAGKLSLPESIWLAALLDAPDLPPDRERFQNVVNKLFAQGMLSATQASAAINIQVNPRVPDKSSTDLAPAFSELVLDSLAGEVPAERLKRGGLKIITTLDYDLQLQTTCALAEQLKRLGTQSSQAELPAGLDCQAARLLPTIPTRNKPAANSLAANAVILSPNNGQILAFVGDPNHSLNPAFQPGHPPGTLLTPLIYLTSFTRGMSPATLAWDIPSKELIPEINSAESAAHGPVRLRTALANDYVVPAAQLLLSLGSENVWRIARQLGITLEAPTSTEAAQKLLLEGGKATLLEMSQAFSALANQGTLAGHLLEANSNGASTSSDLTPTPLIRLEDTAGRTWLDWSSAQVRPIVSPQLAYLLTNVLSDETARWPSQGHPNPLEIGRPAAAKTGKTSAGRDAWTIGYTPQMLTGVWVGNLAQGDPAGVTPEIPAALWHALMQYAHRDQPSQSWSIPAGISTLDVCDPSGMLPTPACPNVVSEVFLPGSEPAQADTLYRPVQINRETGLLATVFTPSELVEDRVFMQVPAEAAAWAQQAGIATAPEAYDVITSNTASSADAVITSPGMFSYVSGKVPIQGTANGPDFSFYRIQIGQGLNPQAWLQVGDDIKEPVQDDTLAVWDTTGLSGLYALQLLVGKGNQRAERNIIQVTVDNQPPTVKILDPLDGGETDSPQVTFQVEAADDLKLSSLAWYLDDQLIASLNQPPFAVVWQATPGKHTLRVVATDQAGNTSFDQAAFTSK